MRLPVLFRGFLAVVAASLSLGAPSMAQVAEPDPALSRDKLMVVLRESAGANKPDEVLKPAGKLRASLRVSSALYLFREGKWSVFQAPLKQ